LSIGRQNMARAIRIRLSKEERQTLVSWTRRGTNELMASSPDTELHVILDNLNSHKPKNDRWSSRHPDIHFHYTPTKVAWLNQIEIWFSILSRRGLKNRSFTSPRQLRDAIDRFLEAYNKEAQPFRWLKKRVYQKRLTKSYAYLDN
jgi:transposase